MMTRFGSFGWGGVGEGWGGGGLGSIEGKFYVYCCKQRNFREMCVLEGVGEEITFTRGVGRGRGS